MNRNEELKGFFAEANEGHPKLIKKLAQTAKPSCKITILKSQSGESIRNQHEILAEISGFYKKLYQEKYSENHGKKEKYLHKFFERDQEKVNKYKNGGSLDHEEILESQVHEAMNKLNPESAHGPDGFTSNFYKKFSHLFTPLLTDPFNNMVQKNTIPPSFQLAIIKLLPKKFNKVKKVDDFRHISLINTDQKILAHVLAKRIKPVSNSNIAKHQYDHLPKRDIRAALTIVKEYVSEMKNEDLLCALDFTKAFDCVDRHFMMSMLECLPIDVNTMTLIKLIYSRTNSIIDINSEFSEKIPITRGVRQGCPQSALLFNLVIEPLLQEIETSSELLSSHKQKVIAFADDINVAMKAISIKNFIKILEKFTQLSGLSINYNKSKILSKESTVPNRHKEKQMKIVTETRILGLTISVKSKIDERTKQDILQGPTEISKFVHKNSKQLLKSQSHNYWNIYFENCL